MEPTHVGLGQGATPLHGCPFLDVEELLSELAERTERLATWEKIRSALSPLKPGESAVVRLSIRLVPRKFQRSFAGQAGLRGDYLFQTTEEGEIKIKRQ